MNMSPLEIISNYLSYVRKYLTAERTYSSLDAEILNRKITLMILGYKVDSSSNLDTVTYLKTDDIYYNRRMFELYDVYIRMDIYKLTGVTFTEFKNMTKKEQEIFLEYVGFKIDSENIAAEIVEETLDKQAKSNMNRKLFDY